MRLLFVLVAVLGLTSCGWNANSRLIPMAERAVPDVTGEFQFEGRTISFERRLPGNLVEVVAMLEDGSTERTTVAFDLLRIVRDDNGTRSFYLIEMDHTTEDGASFGYELFAIDQGVDAEGAPLPDPTIAWYSLNCADASDRFDSDPEQRCQFSRYADLMLAADDLLTWMLDPRIPLLVDDGRRLSED
ncbi:MAG: hypothetical protein KDE15_04130 [Erythrobacter sp.]|nr:hypothetical protein [Erythrobacter sp.]